jgi:tetratricopeptide (TPR) repeat protein
MHLISSRSKWSCLFVLVALLLGGRASAMQLTPAQKQDMKTHYEKATRAYDIQKYGEAVLEYQQAYEIGGDPAMLYNVAQAYRLDNQLPEAIRFYRRYLQRSPNARNREDVEHKIADLEKTVEERRKAAEAAAAAAPPPVVVAPVIAPLPPPPPPAPASNTKRVVGIVLASVGGAALVTAAITGELASKKADQLTTESMKGLPFNPSLESSGKALNTVAIVSAIVGGAAAVAGVILIVLPRGSAHEERQASISPVVGGGIFGANATVQF